MEFIIMLGMVLLLLIGIAGNYYIFKRPLKEAVGTGLFMVFFVKGIGHVARADYLSIVIGIALLTLSVVVRHYAYNSSLKDTIKAGLIVGLLTGFAFILL